MKKILLISFVMFLISFSFVSAIGETKEFIKNDTTSKYGIISIKDNWNLPLVSSKVAEFELKINSDECFINCYSEGTVVINKKSSIFTGIEFKNIVERNVDVLNYKFFIKQPIQKEILEDVFGKCQYTENKTVKEYDCLKSQIKKVITVNEWIPYNFEELNKGKYEWRIEISKRPYQNVDWIASSNNVKLDEWTWLFGNWSKKKQVIIEQNFANVTNGIKFIQINYDNDMNSNYSDLRFANSEETIELPFVLEWYNSTNAYVSVQANYNITNTTLYMYYGNPSAATPNYLLSGLVHYYPFNDYTSNITDYGSWQTNMNIAGTNPIFYNYINGTRLATALNLSNTTLKRTYAIAKYNDTSKSVFKGNYTIVIFANLPVKQQGFVFYAMTQGAHPCPFDTNIYDASNTGIGNIAVVSGQCTSEEFTFINNFPYFTAGQFSMASRTNGTNLTAYLNGRANSSITTTLIPEYSIQNSTIGARDDGFPSQITDNSTGIMDAIFVWNRTLSDGEIIFIDSNKNQSGIYFGNELTSEGITVTLNSPANNFKSSNLSIYFNASMNPMTANITNYTFNIWYSNSTQYYSLFNNTNDNINYTISHLQTLTLPDENSYIWNVEACGLLTVSLTEQCFTATNRTLTLHTGVPYFNIYLPINITSNSSMNNVTININATDPFIDKCYYNTDENSTFQILTCGQLFNSTFYNFGKHNINFYANNTFGTYNFTNVSFYITPIFNINSTCINPILTFNLVEENNLTSIIGNYQYNFKFGPSGNTSLTSYYGNVSGSSTLSICGNISSSTSFYIGSGEVFYQSAGFSDRRYYTFSDTLLEINMSNITIVDILTSEQTTFQLIVQSNVQDPYENAITQLLRWYPNLNRYMIVDVGLTDNTGSTVIHVKTDDVDYRIAVYYLNGSLIYMASPTRIFCASTPCQYTLTTTPSDVDYTSFETIQKSLSYNNNTNIWTFVYTDTTGRTTQMNLTIYKNTGDSSRIICSGIANGATGAITCNTSGFEGTLTGIAYRSASPQIPVSALTISTINSAFKNEFGLWLMYILATAILLAFCLISPIMAIIGGIICLLPAYYFGAVPLEVIGILAIMAGIILHFTKRIG